MRSGGFRWAAGLLVLAGVLSGCTSTVTGTAAAAPTAPPPPPARLQAALPTPADLPAGWEAPGEQYPEDILTGLATCLGKRTTLLHRLAVKVTPDIVDAEGDAVHATDASLLSQRDVDADDALLRAPGASDCLGAALRRDLDYYVPWEYGGYGAPTYVLTPRRSGDPGSLVATWTGAVPVTDSTGEPFQLFFEYVFLSGRRAEAQLTFFSSDAPLPEAVRGSLIGSVAGRLAAL